MSRTHILIIETSTPEASIAMVGNDGVIAQHTFCSDRNHNALLFEPLAELLAGQGREQVGLILVGSGPGSYSGTRVGIAAAQGVAIALGCPAIAVPSILAVPSADNGAKCLAIGDARRGSYWSAMMEHSQLLESPVLCDADGLASILATAVAEKTPIIAFESADRFPVADELKSSINVEHPDATRLWNAWQSTTNDSRTTWSAKIPQPLYLKPPHITPGKRASLLKPQ